MDGSANQRVAHVAADFRVGVYAGPAANAKTAMINKSPMDNTGE